VSISKQQSRKEQVMAIVEHIIKEFLPQLEDDERKVLLNELVRLIDSELVFGMTDDAAPTVCPRCGCPHTIKKGRTSIGTQRYLCKGCARLFTPATNKLLATSKLPREAWVAYVRAMVFGCSLRQCAADVGVGLKTSFFMRHRICECMAGYVDVMHCGAGCAVEIDELYIRESFKGNHGKGNSFRMPRKPKRRSTASGDARGIGHNQIGILTAINDRGSIMAQVACRGTLNQKAALSLLEDKALEGAIVSTDWQSTYGKVLAELNVAVHNRYSSTYRREGVINAVNSLHARLRSFLEPFKGVATRRLSNYLVWFCWLESFKTLYKSEERKDLMVKHLANGTYETHIRDYPSTPYPFGEYWGLAC
jgi:transposase-like protein